MADLKAVMAAVRFKTYLSSLEPISREAVLKECVDWATTVPVGSVPDPQKGAVLNWLQGKQLMTAAKIDFHLHEIWIPFFTFTKSQTLQDLIKAMDL